MPQTIPIEIPQQNIADFCQRWQITELALFGSALRDDFGPDSDIDLLASFDPEARLTLLDHVQMQDELKILFGREVDLVSKRGLEQSHNVIRREAILGSAQVIYATK
ncbi:MAG: nucleotidyltransferase family protein [Anaerolineae bacterium]|nr:nucleotidyltransferase family protein [Anaerolineae bacterium]